MAVRSLDEAEVELYKSLRLRALWTDPDAFGSNHAYEAAFDAATWQARLRGFAGRPGVVLVHEFGGDTDDEQPSGMIGVGKSERPGEAVIWGMWVDPTNRRQGVARSLLDAAIDWARANRCRTIQLTVYVGNDGAHRLYQNAGFVGGEPVDGQYILGLHL